MDVVIKYSVQAAIIYIEFIQTVKCKNIEIRYGGLLQR